MRILAILFIFVSNMAYAGINPVLPEESSEACAPVLPASNSVSSVELTLNATQVVFDFYFSSDYENGLGANHDNYFSASVDANVRWELGIWANSNLLHTNGINSIPINQVGIEVDLVGNFNDSKICNNAKNHPKALQLIEYVLLEPRNKNKSNAGDDADNAFIFYWEMGTGNGNMNNNSLQSGGYGYGTYQTTVNFLLRELL